MKLRRPGRTLPLPESATDETGAIAQRPRLGSRLRLVPLVALVCCALAAGVAGTVTDTPLSDPAAAAAADQADRAAKKATKKAAQKVKRCTPGYNAGRPAVDPWGPGRARASEKAFKARIRKENAAYVKGRHGFAFFTDYQSEDFSQSLGRVEQTPKQAAKWARYFVRSKKAAAKVGSAYYVVIAPSKNDIYRQALPGWAQKLRGETSLEQLLKTHREVPWIDVRSALRSAGSKQPTYDPLDSHWSPYGGYVAWAAIAKCLGTDASLDPISAPAITGVARVAGFNEFAPQGLVAKPDSRTVPVLAQPHPPTVITSVTTGQVLPTPEDNWVDLAVLPAMTTTTGAQSDGTLLLMRDSYGNSLSPQTTTSFAKTVQIDHKVNYGTTPALAPLLTQYQPQVTLFVMTERYLSNNPPPA